MQHFVKVLAIVCMMPLTSNTYADRSAGTHVDDGILHSKVKAELIGNSFFGGLGINIEVSEGVVQLAGFVDSQKQSDSAEKSAADVKGVVRVINQLHLKSGERSSGQVVDDRVIASKVKAGIAGDLSINVDVYNGVVLLSGFANRQDEKAAAIDVAKNTKYVKKVISGIEVRDSESQGHTETAES